MSDATQLRLRVPPVEATPITRLLRPVLLPLQLINPERPSEWDNPPNAAGPPLFRDTTAPGRNQSLRQQTPGVA